ncbi:helix-turn-helix transcriptional regulator [Seonamhaeicola sp.]|uniref:helix-turn-helix domain-containing protein n=1 Tax=Seonamhaeicola sp. TaxID=1912245 RepID=UPI00263826F7|nr:helix-turn-helix transcriptional regulator [Seonamhaeicola sp.]
MPNQPKSVVYAICLFVLLTNIMCGFAAVKHDFNFWQTQIDSLIKEQSINNDMTQLELLVLYQNAWKQKHADSINIFRNLAILNAELEQPEDALKFTEKYIRNTLDFSILKNGSYDAIKGTDAYNVLNKKYRPQITILSFVYFCAALIGFYFMVVINFIKNASRNAKLFIGCFVGVHSLFILEFVLFMTNLRLQFPHTYRISSTVALLFGPLLFLYFRSILKYHKFKMVDVLHFLPALVFLTLFFPLYAMTPLEKLKLMIGVNPLKETYDFSIFISKVTSLSIYAFFIGKLLFSKSKNEVPKKDDTSKWKRNIFMLHIAYIVSYLVYGASIFDVLGSWSTFISHFQIALMSLMVVYIAQMAYVQPEIFRRNHLNLIEKYQKSGLTNALSNELKENLIKLLIQDKVYKENNISLEILSNKLNTTRHNTSQIINEHFGMNFFELINKFRIKEAVNILKDDIHGSLHIIDIAYEVGYNNKVTFNKAFKKEMSVTPSEFIQSQIRNNYK